MTSDPLWEWVEDGPARWARYAGADWTCLGIALVLIGFLSVSGLVLPATKVAATPLYFLGLAALVIFLAGVTTSQLSFQSRSPIVLRLGFSPLGVRLKLPLPSSLRSWTVPAAWANRPVICSNWVGIRVPRLLERYGLATVSQNACSRSRMTQLRLAPLYLWSGG